MTMYELIIGLITNHEVATSTSFITLLILILHLLDKRAIAPYLKGYSEQVGQIRAMKENFDNLVIQTRELTTITETIKGKISDDFWDRQEQWKLRRDAIADTWRNLQELETSLINLHSAFSCPIIGDEKADFLALKGRYAASKQFEACNTRFLHAKDFADLVIGKELPTYLSAYFKQVGGIAKEIINKNPGYYTSEQRKELADKYNLIRLESRKELNIKNADGVVV